MSPKENEFSQRSLETARLPYIPGVMHVSKLEKSGGQWPPRPVEDIALANVEREKIAAIIDYVAITEILSPYDRLVNLTEGGASAELTKVKNLLARYIHRHTTHTIERQVEHIRLRLLHIYSEFLDLIYLLKENNQEKLILRMLDFIEVLDFTQKTAQLLNLPPIFDETIELKLLDEDVRKVLDIPDFSTEGSFVNERIIEKYRIRRSNLIKKNLLKVFENVPESLISFFEIVSIIAHEAGNNIYAPTLNKLIAETHVLRMVFNINDKTLLESMRGQIQSFLDQLLKTEKHFGEEMRHYIFTSLIDDFSWQIGILWGNVRHSGFTDEAIIEIDTVLQRARSLETIEGIQGLRKYQNIIEKLSELLKEAIDSRAESYR